MLTEAFADYSWTRWAIPSDGYLWRLRESQRLYLSYALDAGVVLVDHDVSGVIALLPHTAEFPDSLQPRIVELFRDRLEAAAKAGLPAPPAGYWTLETLGVRPSDQGAGLGTRLVRAGLDLSDKAGAPGVALSTSSDSNVRLYERSGFAVSETTHINEVLVVHSMSGSGKLTN